MRPIFDEGIFCELVLLIFGSESGKDEQRDLMGDVFFRVDLHGGDAVTRDWRMAGCTRVRAVVSSMQAWRKLFCELPGCHQSRELYDTKERESSRERHHNSKIPTQTSIMTTNAPLPPAEVCQSSHYTLC